MGNENTLNFRRQPGSENSTGSTDNSHGFYGSIDSDKIPLFVKQTTDIAEMNAGKIIIPGVEGFRIRVVNFIALPNGTHTIATSVDLEDENAVKVAVLLVAALTNGAAVMPNSAFTSVDQKFGVRIDDNVGLRVKADGTVAGGTDIDWLITYLLEQV